MLPETRYSAAQLLQERQEWDKVHSLMKAAPPQDGRDYLSHANNLLSFLQGICELHPIAKAVIVSFKTLVMFEQTRRENDARVTAVFLAQTDLMRVLLDIDEIANRRPQRSNSDTLRTGLEKVLGGIEHEINACGNSIDMYYKQSRLVKFWKAVDWKNRILGHINGFNKFRAELQEALSIQVASGVDDLGVKMDLLLVRLFAPKHEWEKELDKETHRLGLTSSSIQDPNALQSLISVTKDPSLSIPRLTEDSDPRTIAFVTSRIEEVQKELELSLDALCEKNIEWFELKLNFHAQQTQETIIRSAQMVVQTLSGPYGRVYDEDLRDLWKEMNWIFYVETKLFTRALFEYYIDRFSITSAISYSAPKKKYAANGSIVSSSSTSFLLQSDHPDAWTLEYIAQGDRIARIIDSDNSGFVRISEANSVATQIPRGYNLSQWFAYLVAGCAFEARVYRKRINLLLLKLIEMQARVLSSNREEVVDAQFIVFDSVCHAFCREPQWQDNLYVSPDLSNFVKEKIIAQDAALRTQLDALKWSIQDESAVHLLFGEKDPETYILSLCTVMLEHVLKVCYVGCSASISFADWSRIEEVFEVMRSVCVKQIETLTDQLRDITTYCGGIWSFFDDFEQTAFEPIAQRTRTTPLPYTAEEIDYLSSISDVLVDFPLPPPTNESMPYLIERLPQVERLESLDRFNLCLDTRCLCDRCDDNTGKKTYGCLQCPDFDLCTRCYSLPEEDHSVGNHTYQHPVLLISLGLITGLSQRLVPEAHLVLKQIRRDLQSQKHLNSNATILTREVDGTSESQGALDTQYACSLCSRSLPLDSTFYRCLGHLCHSCFLCSHCAQKRDEVDASAEHHWSHTLLEIRRDVIESGLPLESYPPQASTKEIPAEIRSENSETRPHEDFVSITDSIKSIIEENLQLNNSILEEKIQLNNATQEKASQLVEERLTRLESKIDNIMLVLKELPGRLEH